MYTVQFVLVNKQTNKIPYSDLYNALINFNMDWLSKTAVFLEVSWKFLILWMASKDHCENRDQGPLQNPRSHLIVNHLDAHMNILSSVIESIITGLRSGHLCSCLTEQGLPNMNLPNVSTLHVKCYEQP